MSHTYSQYKVYNLYLSCTWNHQEMRQQLLQLLELRNDFTFRTFSLEPRFLEPVSDERILYEAIRSKIKHCDAVLLMCGVYSTYSSWINKEFIAAKSELHKPVVGIQPFDPGRTSFLVKQNADALIAFQADAIIDTVKKLVGDLPGEPG